MKQVDAFADAPFSGNPAAVMLVPHGVRMHDTLLNKIAAENNLSETAFVQPLSSKPSDSFERGEMPPHPHVDGCAVVVSLCD